MHPSLLIAVCTYRRPDLLARCLRSVLAQLAPHAEQVRLAVIDNDPEQSARDVAAAEGETSGHDILYAAEPRTGIPHARNRAVELCLETGADWLVFIDDDAMAEPGWLAALLRAVREHDADAILGPVEKPLPDPLPFWAVPPRSKSREEGAVLPVAVTNNVAIRAGVFRAHPSLRFDTEMRFTGGSDTDFFRRLVAAGGTIRWSNGPRLREPVTPERLTFRWQMARKFRTAGNDIHIYRKLKPVPGLYARRGARALWFLVSGAVVLAGAGLLFAFSPRRFKLPVLRGSQQIFWALGTFAAMLGRSAKPYRPDRILTRET